MRCWAEHARENQKPTKKDAQKKPKPESFETGRGLFTRNRCQKASERRSLGAVELLLDETGQRESLSEPTPRNHVKTKPSNKHVQKKPKPVRFET